MFTEQQQHIVVPHSSSTVYWFLFHSTSSSKVSFSQVHEMWNQMSEEKFSLRKNGLFNIFFLQISFCFHLQGKQNNLSLKFDSYGQSDVSLSSCHLVFFVMISAHTGLKGLKSYSQYNWNNRIVLSEMLELIFCS